MTEVRPDPNYPVQGDESWHWPIMPRAVRSVGTMELERPIVARLPLAVARERRNIWFGIERPKYTEPTPITVDANGWVSGHFQRFAPDAEISVPSGGAPITDELGRNVGVVTSAHVGEGGTLVMEGEINDPDKWFGMLTIGGLSTGDNRG